MCEPLGFALYEMGNNQKLRLDMVALVYRLIAALLDATARDYVRSPVNTRQRHGLRIE